MKKTDEDDKYLDFQVKLQNACVSLHRCHKAPTSCIDQFGNDHANCSSSLGTDCDY